MPGIKDVAKKAGVSMTTASRVLNHVDYPVAPATRRRVESAAHALHYSPSALARALVTRRSGIVGVLLGDMVDPYFAEIARGVEDAARRAGYLVIVCNTDREPAVERRYVETLSDYRVDGLIFVGGDIVAPGERRKLKQLLALASKRGMVVVACAGEHAAPRDGVAAMDAIVAALDSQSIRLEPRHFPHQIVVRESSAPPRGAARGQEELAA